MAPLSSGPAASSSVASPVATASEPVSSVPPGVLIANIEAPATKAGFKVRLHKGSILKVNPVQPKAGSPLSFALDPAGSKLLVPIVGSDGYFTGAANGVVTVKVSQGGAVIGTLAVTVWS